MIRKHVLGALMAGSMFAIAIPAMAQSSGSYTDFLTATCGVNCADPAGEQAANTEIWKSLEDLGVTNWIGSAMGETTIDPSALLAAAREVGALELFQWLNTGSASTPNAASSISNALTTMGGFDVQRITGSKYTSDAGSSSSFNTASAGGSGYSAEANCSPAVESAQNAASQRYVSDMVQAATSKQYGFSQLGGMAVSGNKRSESGLFGGSCLDIFMKGERDMLFRPPQLSELVNKLTQMFGAESAGGCTGGPTVMEQVTASMPNSVFQSGNGGFRPEKAFPAENFNDGLSFENGWGLADFGGSQPAQKSSFASIF